MGLYIELPENWARFSLEVTDVHGHELEAKVIDTDFDLVRCWECKYWERNEECKLDSFWEKFTKSTDFCSYGKRKK